MNNTVQMLAQHGVTMPPEALKLIEELPDEWKAVVSKSYGAKDKLTPLQAAETGKTLKVLQDFNEELMAFREEFRQKGPFMFLWGLLGRMSS